MRGCSCAEVVFLTCVVLTRHPAACVSHSDSITLAGPVSPRTLNAACLCVKVESIKILTARPVLNWPCAVFASCRYNTIRCHGRDERDLALGARTNARELPPPVRAWSGHSGEWEGHTHAAQHWVQLTGECSSLWLAICGKVQTNCMSIARLITVK